MTERVLNDMTRLGSALADLASQQIDAVLKQFQRPADGKASQADIKVDAEALIASTMQVVSKLGTLLTEFSKYDLVRRNDAIFRVGTPRNPISSLDCERSKPTPYAFWVENESVTAVKLSATLVQPTDKDKQLPIVPALDALQPGERRRVSIDIPAITVDGSTVLFEARVGVDLKSTRTLRLIPNSTELVDPNAST